MARRTVPMPDLHALQGLLPAKAFNRKLKTRYTKTAPRDGASKSAAQTNSCRLCSTPRHRKDRKARERGCYLPPTKGESRYSSESPRVLVERAGFEPA